ncbi:hypothetical protein BU17DRAFT_65907 [Hysterangium stoloniferum]|nr:hypothetical protein BU17DRAFT_65907 [Hysterangium stoloniferum]
MSIIFGDLINAFVAFPTSTSCLDFTITDPNFITAANNFKATAANDAAKLTYIGIVLLDGTYLYMLIRVHTEVEEIHIRCRRSNDEMIGEKYLRAILRQDIAFFDNVGAGEVATRIQTDTPGSSEPEAACSIVRSLDTIAMLVSLLSYCGICEARAMTNPSLTLFINWCGHSIRRWQGSLKIVKDFLFQASYSGKRKCNSNRRRTNTPVKGVATMHRKERVTTTNVQAVQK